MLKTLSIKWKVEKTILDPDPYRTYQFQNLTGCSFSESLPNQKNHAHSSTSFWANLFFMSKMPYFSMLEKMILYPLSRPGSRPVATSNRLVLGRRSVIPQKIWFKSANNALPDLYPSDSPATYGALQMCCWFDLTSHSNQNAQSIRHSLFVYDELTVIRVDWIPHAVTTTQYNWQYTSTANASTPNI